MEKSPLEKLLAGELYEQEPNMSVGAPAQIPMMSTNAPAPQAAPVAPAPKSGLQDPGLRQAEAALANLPVDTTEPPKPESQLERLERLAQEMQASRNKELEDANRRQMYQDMLAGVNSNLGLIVGGAQAMNTKAAVQAPKAGEIKQRDLAKEVSERYKGDQEALMEKYKSLLKAQQDAAEALQRQEDKMEDRKFRREMLNATMDEKGEMFDRGEYRRVTDRIQSVAQNYENDTVVKKFKEQDIALSQVGDIISAMESGNQVAAKALGAKMAKAMGEVGALTEQDVTRYIQAGSILRGSADKFKRFITGDLTDATAQDLKVLAQMMNDGARRKIYPLQDKYYTRAVNYAKQANIPAEEVADMMGFTNLKSVQREEAPKVNPKDEQAKKWLEKNPNHPRAAEVRAKLGL